MKVLVSADWHLKLGQKNVPIEWTKRRYSMLFDKLHKLESQVELHVIAGDLFDRLPNMEELALYFEFISGCKIQTIIIPGNHEASKRNTTFLTYLKDVTKTINPLVEIIDEYWCLKQFDIDIIPYNRLKEFEKDPKEFQGKVLFTHVRGDILPHVKAEINLELLDRWEVVLAGDLHSYENSQRNILYPGSPLTTSFHRNNVDCGVIIFDLMDMSHIWINLELPQLIRKTIQAGEDMPAGTYDHIVYEVEGDMSELGDLEDNELIDKKVMKRDSDTALILVPEMTLQEELREYLLYILNINEEIVESAVSILTDNMGKIND